MTNTIKKLLMIFIIIFFRWKLYILPMLFYFQLAHPLHVQLLPISNTSDKNFLTIQCYCQNDELGIIKKSVHISTNHPDYNIISWQHMPNKDHELVFGKQIVIKNKEIISVQFAIKQIIKKTIDIKIFITCFVLKTNNNVVSTVIQIPILHKNSAASITTNDEERKSNDKKNKLSYDVYPVIIQTKNIIIDYCLHQLPNRLRNCLQLAIKLYRLFLILLTILFCIAAFFLCWHHKKKFWKKVMQVVGYQLIIGLALWYMYQQNKIIYYTYLLALCFITSIWWQHTIRINASFYHIKRNMAFICMIVILPLIVQILLYIYYMPIDFFDDFL